MVGCNCSIYGCNTSRRHVGLAIFKIPKPSNAFNTEWRENVLKVVLKDRVLDSQLKKQVMTSNVYVSEKHYLGEEMIRHEFYIYSYQSNPLHGLILRSGLTSRSGYFGKTGLEIRMRELLQ